MGFPRGLKVYCCVVSIVFLTFLWSWYTAPNTWPPLAFPDANTQHADHPTSDLSRIQNPDASRPQIRLHPDSHMYREPITQYQNWTVTTDYLRPDGVLKQVFLINGMFPGPTVEARSGDTLIINVLNSLSDEEFTIHWHGLHIENSMDGAASVTQHAIPPGASFTYKIRIPSEQSGTFWYHAHAGLKRADGLYGGFIVHPAAPTSKVRGLLSSKKTINVENEKDVLLLVGDWYHRSAKEVMAWYMRAGSFGNEPVPDSLLINGMGHFNCSMAVPARPLDCVGNMFDLSNILPTDSTYKLRVVNTGSLAGFTLTFNNHESTVLAVDSMQVQPQKSLSIGTLYPGQRMDLHIQKISENKESMLQVHLDEECFKYPNPALTSTQTFSMSARETPSVVFLDPEPSFVDIQDLPSTEDILSEIPQTASVDITEVVYAKVQKLSIRHNVPYGFFNRTSWVPQDDPSVPLIDLAHEKWDKNQLSLAVNGPLKNANSDHDGTWVDLIVNNLDDSGHPFHLHGNHFYILAVHQATIGWGSYNPFVDEHPPGLDIESFPHTNGYNLSQAMLRDTVYIPRHAYAVLRFKADNPGVWMFHCHILWHLASGMAMFVDVTSN